MRRRDQQRGTRFQAWEHEDPEDDIRVERRGVSTEVERGLACRDMQAGEVLQDRPGCESCPEAVHWTRKTLSHCMYDGSDARCEARSEACWGLDAGREKPVVACRGFVVLQMPLDQRSILCSTATTRPRVALACRACWPPRSCAVLYSLLCCVHRLIARSTDLVGDFKAVTRRARIGSELATVQYKPYKPYRTVQDV